MDSALILAEAGGCVTKWSNKNATALDFAIRGGWDARLKHACRPPDPPKHPTIREIFHEAISFSITPQRRWSANIESYKLEYVLFDVEANSPKRGAIWIMDNDTLPPSKVGCLLARRYLRCRLMMFPYATILLHFVSCLILSDPIPFHPMESHADVVDILDDAEDDPGHLLPLSCFCTEHSRLGPTLGRSARPYGDWATGKSGATCTEVCHGDLNNNEVDSTSAKWGANRSL